MCARSRVRCGTVCASRSSLNEYRLPVGCPWLTAAIDVYSQTVVGYYLTFEPPSYLSVMYCLLHSIRPKEYVRSTYKYVKNNWTSYGLMENLKVDNGTDFTGRSLEDACRELKINLDFAPVRMPWYKAAIERFFGSLKTQLTGSIPGRCLQLLKESDYDPKKQSVVTLDGLQEILHHFIVDIHNQSGHTQLKSPRAEVWKQAIQSYPISIPSSDDSLKVLLGDKETKAAKTSKQIIKFLGTGRGENVIRSPEESLEMAEESAHIDDIISEVRPLISNSVNSGISDFSSAFGTTKENNQISTQENSAQPEEGKGVDAKKSTINTQTKLLPSIGENTR